MDIGKPLIEYGPVDATDLRTKMLALPPDFWSQDQASRMTVAGDRPGNSVFFYNARPPGIRRMIPAEIPSGWVSVLRYPDRPLFGEVNILIDRYIRPHFPNCDLLWAQLAELPPGGIIPTHSDLSILSRVHRLHIPLVTHEKVLFTIDGGIFHLRPDTLYDLNNVAMHSVVNSSDIMRVHLLVDMMPHSIARVRYFDTPSEDGDSDSALRPLKISN